MSKAEYPLVPVGDGDLVEASGAPGEAPESTQFDPLRKVLAVMRGRWPWAIGLGLGLAIIGAVLGFFSAVPTYRSLGRIRIAPELKTILYRLPEHSLSRRYDRFVNSQVALFENPRVIEQAYNHQAWQSLSGPEGEPPVSRSEFASYLTVGPDRGTEDVIVQFEHPDPEVAEAAVRAIISAYMTFRQEQDAKSDTDRMRTLRNLRDRLQSELESVRERRRTAAEEYGTDRLGQLFSTKMAEVNELESELRNLRLALASAEGSRGEAGDDSATGQSSVNGATAGADDGSESGDGADSSEDDEASVDDGQPLEAEALTVEMIAQRDAQMRDFIQRRRLLERTLKRQLNRLGRNHRAVVDTRTELESVEQTIQEYAASFRRQYARRAGQGFAGADGVEGRTVGELRERIEMVEQMYEEQRQEVLELGRDRFEIELAREEEQRLEEELEKTRSRIDALEVESEAGNRVEVLNAGTEAQRTNGRRPLYAGIGVMFGGSLGFGAVLLVGLMDRRMRHSSDAADGLGRISMLGILPRLPDDLADPSQAAIASHCVHQIRTLLQIGAESHGRRVFSFTSPASNTGRTSLTLAMGLSFSASGARTLLIDADLTSENDGITGRVNRIIRRKIGQILQREGVVTEQQVEHALDVAQRTDRRLGETLIELGYLDEEELENALTIQERMPVGLLDALSGEPLGSCIAETGIDNLSILPIGAAEAEDVSRLSPANIGRLFDEARQLYDIVLVDTGPVPKSLEASHVAAEADGVVLAVSRGQQRYEAERAVEHLQSIGAVISGLVFNRAGVRDLDGLGAGSLEHTPRPVVDRTANNGEPASRFDPVARAVASSSRPAPKANGNGTHHHDPRPSRSSDV